MFYEHIRDLSLGYDSFRSGVGAVFRTHDAPSEQVVLPAQEGAKTARFVWRYAGKEYELSETLYDSYYRMYHSLPVGITLEENETKDRSWWEKLDDLFLTPVDGDTTLAGLAQSLREIGRKNNLSDDQMAEFIAAFVQTIPYDQAKTDRRERGQDGVSEKTTYPYEVLYDGTGVCQDKSYLAYRLLQELGYGVSIFLFPDPKDNHMAVGIACPQKYSNYDSGYCFLETTSIGNKIGMIPDISPDTRVATADVEIDAAGDDSAMSSYQPLGRVEVINVIPGKEYTGIINTIRTRDELNRLKTTVYGYKRDLKILDDAIVAEEVAVKKQGDALNSLKKKGEYDEYNEGVKPYNKLVTKLREHIAEYNALVEKSNTAVKRYNALGKTFYAN